MKLVTFTTGGDAEIGVVDGGMVTSLSRAAPRLAAGMIDLIARWSVVEGEVRRTAGSGPKLPLKDVRLLPPIPRPGKILAIGLNYADHILETGHEMPSAQVWFCKQPTAAHGPYDPIVLPKVSKQVDYEAELVAVMGKGGRHIPKDRASEVVFGYCAGNDVSARDWQMATSQWLLGKSFDTHAPFGPWITTADEVADPHVLGVRSFVNGEKRQDSNTRHFVFNVWDQIAHVSKVMTLEPGDIIYTGTPGGVGMGMKPPTYLNAGDRVRIEVDQLGHLEAVCQDEE
ncbi:MAG: fumarylacetoacetate hydrolase family protein [Alphaproteobacteria bacterium]|nr:fumarylacetoacetate hydrolase family protein [Alphaproteobacteria bacterium]MDE1985711.1 fumarylacetoacetate hydrolase family protein [Alphaproteobacteria bacterium]